MKQKIFPYIVLIAALCLACSAAYYSVFGISKLFSAQALAVAIMAGTLEASKLIAATYLHRYWKHINRLLKIYLTTAVCILMFITSLGIYGFLCLSTVFYYLIILLIIQLLILLIVIFQCYN